MLGLFLAVMMAVGWATAHADVSVVANFVAAPNGTAPQKGLILGSDGNFYGTTSRDGSGGAGTVFQITPTGTLKTLAAFDGGLKGGGPTISLFEGIAGDLYGATSYGGAFGQGTIFKVSPGGSLTTLASLNTTMGNSPNAVVQTADGSIFGETSSGGADYHGTLFKLTPGGTLVVLTSFYVSNPGSLILGIDGNVYGTTASTGTGGGTIFKVTPSGSFATLASFSMQVGRPIGNLTQAEDGTFYCAASGNYGPLGGGTVFKLAPSGTVTVIATFDGTIMAAPTGVTMGSDGNLYGTTPGSSGSPPFLNGSLFKLTVSGTGGVTTLVSYPHETGDPLGPFTLGNDGNFYGTTIGLASQTGTFSAVNAGTVFKLTPTGSATTIFSFTETNGVFPVGGLVQASDGNFYGTTSEGGTSNLGTVYRMTPSGTLTDLVSFNGTNGSQASAAMIQGLDGGLYGTTSSGGAANIGTVFRMTLNGTLMTLTSFNGTNGSSPLGPLIQTPDGTFYGTTSGGGVSSDGTVFKMTSSGDLTTMVSFSGADGADPWAALLLATDGNFYGTTVLGGSATYGGGGGTAFRLTPTGDLTTLVSFTRPNGYRPVVALTQGSDGDFYGTTSESTSSYGTLFRLSPSGTVTTLMSSGLGSYTRTGLVRDGDGNLYGTSVSGDTSGTGFVFKLTPSGSFINLGSIPPPAFADRFYVVSNLIMASDGCLYGTTSESGPAGTGIVFKVGNSSQTINFPPIPPQSWEEGSFNVAATASSGLPVSFAINSGPATISGTTVTLTGAGTVTITASQIGDSTHGLAAPVTRSFAVTAIAQTINFPLISTQPLSEGSFIVLANASSGLLVSLVINSGPATVSGNVVTLTGTGTVSIKAYQHGNSNYAAATSITQKFAVINATAQAITFPPIPSHTYGDAAFVAGGSASSGLPVKYQIVSGPAKVSGSTITVTGAGTVVITASQAGNSGFSAATPVTQSLTVAVEPQAITFPTIASQSLREGTFTVTATASSGLPVSFVINSGPATVSGSTVTLTGTGTVSIKAYQHGNANVAVAASLTQKFTVTP